MTHNYNIFIEGIQGSGKSTLLNTISEAFPQYTAYREGDISPVELAWCSYMTHEQYEKALCDMKSHTKEIEDNTVCEDGYYITSYTKVRTSDISFYKYMESYEIYSGRRELSEFEDIILRRYSSFEGKSNIFECSFFQNILDEFLLYKLLDEKQIIDFYRKLISRIDLLSLRLLYIVPDDIAKALFVVKSERINEKGEEEWLKSIMDYFNSSPFGIKNRFCGFDDLTAYFYRRAELEKKICNLLPCECVIKLKSKSYDSKSVIDALK